MRLVVRLTGVQLLREYGRHEILGQFEVLTEVPRCDGWIGASGK